MDVSVLTGDYANKDNLPRRRDGKRKSAISHSIWQSWLACPAALYFSYFLKIDGPKNFALGLGSSIDMAMNEYASAIMEGRMNAVEEAQNAFDTAYRSETSNAKMSDTLVFTKTEIDKLTSKYGEIPAEERYKAEERTKAFWRGWAMDSIVGYHHLVGHTIRPIAVQQKFVMDFGNKYDFCVKGTVDRIDSGGIIIDNKTSKARWSDRDVQRDTQGVCYALFYRIANPGHVENRVQFDIFVKNKTGVFEDRFQQLVVGVTSEKIDLLLSEMSTCYESLRDGQFFRRALKYGGSCSWCEYESDCFDPSHVWSRAPNKHEVEEFLAEDPSHHALLEKWVERESMRARLVNWREVGQEFKMLAQENPEMISFWY